MKTKHLDAKIQKRKEAEARKKIYDALSAIEKLQAIAARPGWSNKETERIFMKGV